MPHSRNTLLKARFEVVRRDLTEVMGRITPEILDWAPAPGMRTTSGQILEILATEIQLIASLKDEPWITDEAAAQTLGDYRDLEVLKQALTDVRQQTLNYLDSFSEADLAEEIEYGAGWFGSLNLPTFPRAEVFLNIADHEWYHVGQLTSYLWSRGDDPYTW